MKNYICWKIVAFKLVYKNQVFYPYFLVYDTNFPMNSHLG